MPHAKKNFLFAILDMHATGLSTLFLY